MEKERRSIYFGKLFPTHVRSMSRLWPQPAQQAGTDFFWQGGKPVSLVRVDYFIAACSRELLLMYERERHFFAEGDRRGDTLQATVCTFIQITPGVIRIKLIILVSKPSALIRVVVSALTHYSPLLSLSPNFLIYFFFLF